MYFLLIINILVIAFQAFLVYKTGREDYLFELLLLIGLLVLFILLLWSNQIYLRIIEKLRD